MAGDDDERCSEWARAGFCEQESYQAYMEANCARSCADLSRDAGGEPADGWAGEGSDDAADNTCGQWAEAGYCEQETYAPYMEEHCAQECSQVSVQARAGVVRPAEEEQEAEEEEGEEPSTCEDWSRQGYCTQGKYVEYMEQNCKKACASAQAGGGAASGGGRSAEECSGWAARGFCHNPEYEAFMRQSCASVCASMPEVKVTAELPPPADPWLVLLIIGFGFVVSYLIRIAYARDVSSSAALRVKEEVQIGTKIGNGGSAKRKAKRS